MEEMQYGSHQEAAAVVIQSHFKRFLAQKRYKEQQAAARTIQANASHHLRRRKAAKDHEQQQQAERFRAVMQRHQERLQQLELEKQCIVELPVQQLDAWQARRQAAAATIQAHWRGCQHRQQLKQDYPTLRPVACASATAANIPGAHSRSEQEQSHILQSTTTAGFGNLAADASAASAAVSVTIASQIGTTPAGLPEFEANSSSDYHLAAEDSQFSAVGEIVMAGAAAAGTQRREAIPAVRRMALERQVQLRTNAYKAAANKQGALRAWRPVDDQRLVHLLQEYQAAAGQHLKAARCRQRLLQEAEALHNQLQQLPKLSQLPDNVTGTHFILPPAGSVRADRARQAHAVALAEAKVGSKWWLPLKALNRQSQQQAAAADESNSALQQEWRQQDELWKSSWTSIRERERQRPDLVQLLPQQGRKVDVDRELCSERSWPPSAVAAEC